MLFATENNFDLNIEIKKKTGKLSIAHIFARGCGFCYSRLRSGQASVPVFHENEAIHGLTPLCGAKVFVKAK